MSMSSDSSSVLLRTKDLSKRFGGLWALRDVNLTVQRGEILGIIGPNGAGKTTMINLLTGYFRPSNGSIEFDGRFIHDQKPFRLCHQGIGRTFQIVQPFTEMSVIENVMAGALFSDGALRPTSEARKIADRSTELVGLGRKRDYPAGILSIGEKKRLELARALATMPRLLILDEVMSGLTGTEVNDTMQIVRDVHQQGVTIILIEHLIKVVLSLSDSVFVLNFGEQIFFGSPAAVVNDAGVVEAYFGKGVKTKGR
jgi:branched-chain amino acid transport system ATP-binding protein